MPDTDRAAVALADIRECGYFNGATGATCARLSDAAAVDVPRLLAAVEAALGHHQPVNRGEGLEPICGTCHRGFWPCPTYEDITAALTGGSDEQ
jgi:hypothetical protein